jgi:hypothetical protein
MLLSLIRMIQAFRDYQRNVSELSQTFRALQPVPITADPLSADC